MSEPTEGFTVDQEQVNKSKKLVFEEIIPKLTEAIRVFDTLSASQPERKWGTEQVALAYKKEYEENLSALKEEFTAIKKRAEEFAEALKQCLIDINENEENNKATLEQLQNKMENSLVAPNPEIATPPDKRRSFKETPQAV